MTPLESYQRYLDSGTIQADESQRHAVEKLQALYDALTGREVADQRTGKMLRVASWIRQPRPEPPVTGLYFWGGVGRGKTLLMDLFYESLPVKRKLRTHFHRFMQRIHRELDRRKGEANPLTGIARDLAAEARVICFDEFFVSDIGDAMILAGLLSGLFDQGVTLVCTSNIVPDGLYREGLQRRRFLPAIDLLNCHTEVVNLDGGTDYRLRSLEQAELYHSSLDAGTRSRLRDSFYRIAVGGVSGMTAGEEDLPEGRKSSPGVEVNGRTLQAEMLVDDVVWFEFSELCDGPRSQNDYIELAREFHGVVISNVPRLTGEREDQAKRFILLVDEFYDRNVKLILSAEVPILSLYSGGRLSFEFERTQSRLLEMQSRDYLSLPHRP